MLQDLDGFLSKPEDQGTVRTAPKIELQDSSSGKASETSSGAFPLSWIAGLMRRPRGVVASTPWQPRNLGVAPERQIFFWGLWMRLPGRDGTE